MEEIKENLTRHMRTLCLEMGSRHCGSSGLEAAGKYVEKVMSSLDVPVFTEKYPVPGWQFGSFEFEDVTAGRKVPAASVCYYSASVELKDVPVWLDESILDSADLPDLRGKLCVFSSWYAKSTTAYYNRTALRLEQLGAGAAIFLSVGQTDLAPNTKIERNPLIRRMGCVSVAQEGALWLANHRENRYHLKICAGYTEAEAFNVIARVGNGPRRAVIGAHYDAAPLIQGAADNAGGTAVLLELLRLLKDRAPREWTIDFAAFSGEEVVPDSLPMGSQDYIKRHGNEPIEWMMNIDGPAAYFDVPIVLLGHPEKLPPLRYPHETAPTSYIGDDKAFGQIGVPSVWIFKRRAFGERHTAEDNLDCIDFPRMEEIVREYLDLFTQLTEKNL